MNKKIKKIKEKLESNKHYMLVMMNFKAPLTIITIGFLVYLCKKLYSINFLKTHDQKLMFFAVSLFICTIIVSKLFVDILSLVFGEKGKGSLVKRD